MILDLLRKHDSNNNVFLVGDWIKGVMIFILPHKVSLRRYIDDDFEIELTIDMIKMEIVRMESYIGNSIFYRGLLINSIGESKRIMKHSTTIRKII